MTEPTTDWPYDARSPENSAYERVPVISTLSPEHAYIAAVCVGSPDDGGVLPNDGELYLIRSYLEFKVAGFSGSFKSELAHRPFDIEPGHATLVLLKHGDGDWGYRWTDGSGTLWPPPNAPGRKPMSLAAVIQRHTDNFGVTEAWLLWVYNYVVVGTGY